MPDQHSVSATKMEEIATLHTEASLARAWELNELMGRLSYVVKPCQIQQDDALFTVIGSPAADSITVKCFPLPPRLRPPLMEEAVF
jgi:hypothetical protein